MEDEKKRKRADDHGGGGERRRRKEGAEAAAAAAQPSEEEVEEFFTILRKMHVAVKYFEKGRSNISNVNEVNGGVDGVKIGGGKRDVVVENGGLDLNAVPEAGS
ncbi:hypothetical protein ACH5RR_008657 [Cinchona calisaya]|uniref:Protein NIM1-INTERACTING 2-like n=1 Tax=Cinchona calisaya TaxID=153742 RepID=A0ABD3AFV8_9GENT